MGTSEISIKVASAVEDVRNAIKNKNIDHKEVTKLIQKASNKYGITEQHIRTVGCLPKKDTKELIKIYNDYDDDYDD